VDDPRSTDADGTEAGRGVDTVGPEEGFVGFFSPSGGDGDDQDTGDAALADRRHGAGRRPGRTAEPHAYAGSSAQRSRSSEIGVGSSQVPKL
jgi:hypothetical protein